MLIKTQMKNVLYDNDLPLLSSLYSSGYVNAIFDNTSLSSTKEKTGNIVYNVAYLKTN